MRETRVRSTFARSSIGQEVLLDRPPVRQARQRVGERGRVQPLAQLVALGGGGHDLREVDEEGPRRRGVLDLVRREQLGDEPVAGDRPQRALDAGVAQDRPRLVAGGEEQPVGVLDEPRRVGEPGQGVAHLVLPDGGVLRVAQPVEREHLDADGERDGPQRGEHGAERVVADQHAGSEDRERLGAGDDEQQAEGGEPGPADRDHDVGHDDGGRHEQQCGRRGRRRRRRTLSSGTHHSPARATKRAMRGPEPVPGLRPPAMARVAGIAITRKPATSCAWTKTRTSRTVPGVVSANSPPASRTRAMTSDQARDQAALAGRTSPRHHTHWSAQKPATRPAARSCSTVTHAGTVPSTMGASSRSCLGMTWHPGDGGAFPHVARDGRRVGRTVRREVG